MDNFYTQDWIDLYENDEDKFFNKFKQASKEEKQVFYRGLKCYAGYDEIMQFLLKRMKI